MSPFIELEKRLWEAADELRANSHLNSSQYSTPILGLIFLKFAEFKFTTATETLQKKKSRLNGAVGQASRRTTGKIDYQAQGVLYIPEKARFSYLLTIAEDKDIGKAINSAMKLIEEENEAVRGVLPKTYTAFENSTLVEVLKIFNSADALNKIRLLDDAAESLIVNEATKKQFMGLANLVQRLFKAILPDALANDYKPRRDVILTIAEKIKSTAPDVDISAAVTKIEKLLDASVNIQESAISDIKGQYGKKIDLSKVDFDKLREQFEKSRKRTELQRLKTAIAEKLIAMVVINRSRLNLLEKFQQMIDEYNNGSASVEAIYEELLKFAKDLSEEEKRHIKEELTEEELAIFDILMKPAPALSNREINKIKKIAKEMLEALKREKFGLEWRRRQQTRASVLLTIQEYLDQLPEEFTPELYQEKCNSVYQFVYEQ